MLQIVQMWDPTKAESDPVHRYIQDIWSQISSRLNNAFLLEGAKHG